MSVLDFTCSECRELVPYEGNEEGRRIGLCSDCRKRKIPPVRRIPVIEIIENQLPKKKDEKDAEVPSASWVG